MSYGWFNATGPGPFDGAVTVRKSGVEGKVCVHNGRHFCHVITQEEARAKYTITSKVKPEQQAQTEDNFQYYLHY